MINVESIIYSLQNIILRPFFVQKVDYQKKGWWAFRKKKKRGFKAAIQISEEFQSSYVISGFQRSEIILGNIIGVGGERPTSILFIITGSKLIIKPKLLLCVR